MTTTACGTCEPGALSMDARVVITCCFFILFCAAFVVTWFAMNKYYKTFKKLTFPVKADNCSRVNSTIHSILVVPTLFIGVLTTSWGEMKEPTSDVKFLQVILCITTAYFLCDSLIMIMYRVPLWGMYLTHHLLAVTPYIIYLFISPCGFGLFLLSCFMLVEFSNFSLNAQAWLEQNGNANTRAYAVCFYITYFGWIACRLINPYLMIYYAHTAIYPSIPSGYKWCFIPSLCCGYLIVVFCTSVFVFVLCAALKKRWMQPSESLTDVAEHHKGDLVDGEDSDNGAARSMTTSNNYNNAAAADGTIINKRTSSRVGKDGNGEATIDCSGMESPTKAIVWGAEKKFEELAAAARLSKAEEDAYVESSQTEPLTRE